MLKEVIKDGNEDVNQDVPNSMCDMLVTEFPTQGKDDQDALVNFEVNRNLVQTSEFETDDEANVYDIVSTIKRNVGGKRTPVNVVVAPLDNVSFHFETSVQK